VTNLEWDHDIGEVKYSGAEILVKKSVLWKTGGYNPNLIAGEDPLFSLEIRKKGYKIMRLNKVMGYHDINMNSLKQYLKRCYRSGYGYTEVGFIFIKKKELDWIKKVIKYFIKTSGTLFFLVFFLVFQNLYLLIISLLLNIMPIIKIPKFKKEFKINIKKSFIYALHLIIAAYPMTVGIYRYFVGRIFNWSLTNKILLKNEK
jgi:GT2 family glycosyltransferase